MSKLEAVIKKVERYELKLSEQIKQIEKLGIDAKAFWASFPAGSEERIALSQLERIQNDLDRARSELVKREGIESKKADKQEPTNKIEEQQKWMQSKTGTWHKFVGVYFGESVASCQSYNLDRTNALYGDPVATPPEGAKVCKKCQGKNSGNINYFRKS